MHSVGQLVYTECIHCIVKELRVCPALTTTSTLDIYSASSLLVIVGSRVFVNVLSVREEVQRKNIKLSLVLEYRG